MKRRIQCLLLSILILLGTFSSSSLGADEPAVSNSIQVGDFLTLGTFDGQPLLWFVVEKNAEKLKLFCAKELFQGQIDASMHEVLAYADLVGGAWEGDSNWHTSDIRTYLNSNEVSVSYKGADKNELPNYASRPGFLTQFTTDELSLVSETTHKSHIQYHRTNKEHDVQKCHSIRISLILMKRHMRIWHTFILTNGFFSQTQWTFGKPAKLLVTRKSLIPKLDYIMTITSGAALG